MIGFRSQVALVAAKDLRIELRSRVTANQVVPFALIVLLLFAFALDPDRGLLPQAAPGLFWVAVLLAGLLAVGRSFAVEAENRTRDALRLSSLDPAAIFLGKVVAVSVQLLALELVLTGGLFLLYDVEARHLGLLAGSALLATLGLAAAGSVYGAIVAGLRVRESLLPVLVLPVAAPVMIAATRAWEAGFVGPVSDAWPWMQVMAVFAALYLALGTLAFGALLEES